MIKRVFDIVFAFLCLMLLIPIILVFLIISSLNTSSNGVFTQKRVGQYGNLFTIYKLRTKHVKNNDISKIGIFIRKYKIDEWLQLINVLQGKMSLVGPRPDIIGYADKLKGEDKKILELKPGITGPASLKYYNEEKILALQEDPIKYNDDFIYPDKVKINLSYYYSRSFAGDIKIIINTIFRTNY